VEFVGKEHGLVRGGRIRLGLGFGLDITHLLHLARTAITLRELLYIRSHVFSRIVCIGEYCSELRRIYSHP